MVDAIAAELMQETAVRDRFQTVTPADLYHSAETFDRYLFPPWMSSGTRTGALAGCSCPIFRIWTCDPPPLICS